MARKLYSSAPRVGTFNLVRAADWPSTLHKAADRYEQANLIAGNAWARGALEMALAELDAAKSVFGRECLALDRQRRPDFYAAVASV